MLTEWAGRTKTAQALTPLAPIWLTYAAYLINQARPRLEQITPPAFAPAQAQPAPSKTKRAPANPGVPVQPPPKPALLAPNTPANIKLALKCAKAANSTFKVHATVEWTDRADNEGGYRVAESVKDGFGVIKFAGTKNLRANSTKYVTDNGTSAIRGSASEPPHIAISIWVFNAAGDSGKLSTTISCLK